MTVENSQQNTYLKLWVNNSFISVKRVRLGSGRKKWNYKRTIPFERFSVLQPLNLFPSF